MPLVFHVLRHAEAAASGPGDDATRPLTAIGETTVRALARRLALDHFRPGRVFTSRRRRAQDTARILLKELGLKPRIEVLVEIDPDREPAAILEALDERGISAGELLVVGHQPQLGGLVTLLTGREHWLRPCEFVSITCEPRRTPLHGSVTLEIPPQAKAT